MPARFSVIAMILLLPLAILFALPTFGCGEQEALQNRPSSEHTLHTEHQQVIEADTESSTTISPITEAAAPSDNLEKTPLEPTPAHSDSSETPLQSPGTIEAADDPEADQEERPGTEICGTITDTMIYQGEVLFSGKGNCQTCHKGDGTGTPLGPNLTDETWLNISGDYPSIISNIKEGVQLPIEHPTPMPPMGGAKLNEEEICALAAYVWTLNR